MKSASCQIHPANQLNFICLCKSCTQSFTLCCNLCKNEKHKQHSGKVIGLTDFYNNLNKLRSELNKKLKIGQHDIEHQNLMGKLKSIRVFRLEISKIQSKLLENALELQKISSDDTKHQCSIISQLQYINLNKSEQQVIQKIKELSQILQYNYIKMKIQVSQPKNRKIKQNKDKITKQTDENIIELKQYLVKLIDTSIYTPDDKIQQNNYSIQQFKQYLQSSISELQTVVKRSTYQVKSLQQKLSNIKQYFQQPFNLLEFENQKSRNQQQILEVSKQLSQIDRKRSIISNISILPPGESIIDLDDRSVACSFDFSRADLDGFNIKQKMLNMKSRLKKLEQDNIKLSRSKKQLQLQLTVTNNKLSLLIQQISVQKQTTQTIIQTKPKSKRKLRLRQLQPISIPPSVNQYKIQFQQILNQYNQVVKQHLEVKQKKYSMEINSQVLEEENKQLKKKVTQSQRQLNNVKRYLGSKDKQIQRVRNELLVLQERLLELKKEEERSQVQNNNLVLIQQLQQKIKGLQLRLKYVQEQKQQQILKNNQLSKQIQSLQNTITQLQKQKQSLQNYKLILSNLNTQLQQIRLKLTESQHQTLFFKQKSQQSKQHQSQLLLSNQQLTTSLSSHQQTILSLQSQIKSTNQQNNQIQSFITVLRKQKKQLSDHNEMLRTQSLKEYQNMKVYSIQQDNMKKEIEQSSRVNSGLKQKIVDLEKEIKGLNLKINAQQMEHVEEKKKLYIQIYAFEEREAENRQEGQIEIRRLKAILEENQKMLGEKKKQYQLKCEETESLKLSNSLKIKLLQAQKQAISHKLAQYLSQLSNRDQQDINKSTKVSDLNCRILDLQKQKMNFKQLSETSKSKNQALHVQMKRLQNELIQQQNKNDRLLQYAKQLQQNNKNLESKHKFKPKKQQIELIMTNLRQDISHLEQKLKDRQLIQKIYIKQLDTKKQQIMRLNRQNDSLRRQSYRKQDKKIINLDKQNKNLKRYLSYGDY